MRLRWIDWKVARLRLPTLALAFAAQLLTVPSFATGNVPAPVPSAAAPAPAQGAPRVQPPRGPIGRFFLGRLPPSGAPADTVAASAQATHLPAVVKLQPADRTAHAAAAADASAARSRGLSPTSTSAAREHDAALEKAGALSHAGAPKPGELFEIVLDGDKTPTQARYMGDFRGRRGWAIASHGDLRTHFSRATIVSKLPDAPASIPGTHPMVPAEARYRPTFVKMADYVTARLDAMVQLKPDSQPLRVALTRTMDILERETGLRPGHFNVKDPASVDRLYAAWIKHVVPEFESRDDASYDAARGRLTVEGTGAVDLGTVLLQKGAVCRELSLAAHVMLAEYGISTKMMTMQLDSGGHAAVRLPDGRILDSNYARAVMTERDYRAAMEKNGEPLQFNEQELVRPKS